MTEAFRSGDTRIWRRGVEAWGWRRGWTQAWHWGLHGYKWPLTPDFPNLNNPSTEAQCVISLQVGGFVLYLPTSWKIQDVTLLFCPGVIKPHNQPVPFAASKLQASVGEFKYSMSKVFHPTHIHIIICYLIAVTFWVIFSPTTDTKWWKVGGNFWFCKWLWATSRACYAEGCSSIAWRQQIDLWENTSWTL